MAVDRQGTGRLLQLVRHAKPDIDPSRDPAAWTLAVDGLDAIDALRSSGRLVAEAQWYCSDEIKALSTAAALTHQPFTVVPELHEARRTWMDDSDAFSAAVEATILQPDRRVAPGWETGREVQERVSTAVRRIVDHSNGHVVLVGHGTAWTLLAARLRDRAAGIDAWRSLQMPDVWTIDLD